MFTMRSFRESISVTWIIFLAISTQICTIATSESHSPKHYEHVRRVDPLEPQVLDDVPRKPFQACMVDQFQVKGQCVKSPICYLYLKLVGYDDWRPGFVQVRMLDEPYFSSDYFYFRRYLPRLLWYGSDVCDSEITPFGVKYTRKVFGKKHVKP
ncbi:uncharacterized protein Fot_32162 [Forsythia ovata]|uniref:Uncharacterized protein n=1 Tax=Forsythia ovata TaxID=205694 RepID=A0ABD1T709_9LAMI